MKLAASQPSTTRWSQLIDRFISLRTAISPSSGTSLSSILLAAMIATSGRLMTGVEAMPPSGPSEVMVIVEPDQFLARGLAGARGLGEPQDLGRELPDVQGLRVADHRDHQPGRVCVAMPRWTAPWRVTTFASSS